jgi:hypothetical protein
MKPSPLPPQSAGYISRESCLVAFRFNKLFQKPASHVEACWSMRGLEAGALKSQIKHLTPSLGLWTGNYKLKSMWVIQSGRVMRESVSDSLRRLWLDLTHWIKMQLLIMRSNCSTISRDWEARLEIFTNVRTQARLTSLYRSPRRYHFFTAQHNKVTTQWQTREGHQASTFHPYRQLASCVTVDQTPSTTRKQHQKWKFAPLLYSLSSGSAMQEKCLLLLLQNCKRLGYGSESLFTSPFTQTNPAFTRH